MAGSNVIELRTGPLVLAVAPGACGAVTRFAYDDGARRVELLRPALETAVADRDPRGMSCFPLVPFSNRIGNGRFAFQGRIVTLPPNFLPEPHAVHGHGWQSAWSVVDQTPSSLTIEYRHAADTWPYPYRARQRYSLAEDRLEIEFTVTNEGTEAMPAGFGAHPYFVRTPHARLRAHVEQMWKANDQFLPSELVAVPAEIPLAGAGINPDEVAIDTNFIGFDGRCEIEWPEFDAGLRVETRGPFTCLVVYTPPNQPFFCVEPVTNCLDAFNLAHAGRTDTGMLVIPPGQDVAGTVTFLPTLGLGNAAR